jgi:hypothetical protein
MRAVQKIMNSQEQTLPLYRYRAYGLAVESDLELPELRRDFFGGADIVIRRRHIARPYPDPPQFTAFEFEPATQYLAWRKVGRYLIRGQDQIDVDPAPDAGEPLVRLPLLGPVMAVLLHLRGLLVLHASAVAIGGQSAIFLGDKQAGKSTTAAALVAAGHRLLADDTLAVEVPQLGTPSIVPGFPQIKLSSEAAAAVADKGRQAQPLPYEGFGKRQHLLIDRFSHERTALTRIYVLSRGTDASTKALAPPEALMALVRFSYVKRFGPQALGETAGRHLQQCARLANTVEVCRLEVPSGLDRLDEAVRLIERHVG